MPFWIYLAKDNITWFETDSHLRIHENKSSENIKKLLTCLYKDNQTLIVTRSAQFRENGGISKKKNLLYSSDSLWYVQALTKSSTSNSEFTIELIGIILTCEVECELGVEDVALALLPGVVAFCKDSNASSSFRFFFLPPIASRAVLLAALFRLSSSSSSCI